MSSYHLEPQNLARSCHEALILAVLSDGPRHGYQLALEIEERSGGGFGINHGTLYPILREMEAVGHLEGTWAASAGRRRRTYALTRSGRRHLERLRRAWREFGDRLGAVVVRGD
jgi:DNA-binding PadR family transcriptional regulator